MNQLYVQNNMNLFLKIFFVIFLVQNIILADPPAANGAEASGQLRDQSAESKSDNDYIVAIGMGITVTSKQLDEAFHLFLSQRKINQEQMPAEAITAIRKDILHQLVTKELISSKAQQSDIERARHEVNQQIEVFIKSYGSKEKFEEHMAKQGTTQKILERDMTEKFLMRNLIEKFVTKPTEPTQEEIEQYYVENEKHFQIPERVDVSHVLISVPVNADDSIKAAKKKMAQDALDRVKNGEDFALVAADVSEDPQSKNAGGSLGLISRKQLVPEFDQVAFSTKPGELSDVFVTPFGYHFLKVTEKQDARTKSLIEVNAQIKSYLMTKKRSNELNNFIQKIQEEGFIIYYDNIP